jgi:DHA3 family macrolide efflux protein-like MFS transporter
LGQGFTYIKNHAYIKHFFIFCAVFMVLAAPAAFLTPLQVTRSFGNDVLFIQAFFLIGNKVLVEAGKPIPKLE